MLLRRTQHGGKIVIRARTRGFQQEDRTLRQLLLPGALFVLAHEHLPLLHGGRAGDAPHPEIALVQAQRRRLCQVLRHRRVEPEAVLHVRRAKLLQHEFFRFFHLPGVQDPDHPAGIQGAELPVEQLLKGAFPGDVLRGAQDQRLLLLQVFHDGLHQAQGAAHLLPPDLTH